MSHDDDGVRHLFTPAEAERLFKIPASTVRNWHARRRIYPYGLDSRGRPLFDRVDLLRLMEGTLTRDQHAQARRAARNARRRPSRDTG